MSGRNERNAGRKPALTQQQQKEAIALYQQGSRVKDLASQYGISRQSMSSYLHPDRRKPEKGQEGFVLQLDYMYQDQCCTSILVNFGNRQIRIENQTEDILHRAFGVKMKPAWEDFEHFLEERCVPKSRDQIENVLADMGLDFYDPLLIAERTQGRMAEDQQWLRFHYLLPSEVSI